jgi:hypothetical protein
MRKHEKSVRIASLGAQILTRDQQSRSANLSAATVSQAVSLHLIVSNVFLGTERNSVSVTNYTLFSYVTVETAAKV